MGKLGVDSQNAKNAPKEIEETTGLLVEQADGWHSFAHLTLQEFLASEYIARNEDRALNVLKKHSTTKDWEEVFIITPALMDDADAFLQALWKVNKTSVLKALQTQIHCSHTTRKMYFNETLNPLLKHCSKYPVFHFYKKINLVDLINLRYLRDRINLRYRSYLRNLIDDLRDLINYLINLSHMAGYCFE